MLEFWKRLALMADGDFIAWASDMGFTPRPMHDGLTHETIRDFRARVCHCIERVGEELNG